MAKKLKRIKKKPELYDLVIIGGGISGATVFYDACQRGLKCLLIEKSDFASGTSQATSRLVHGGLRYLKNLEIGLVRESLRERRILAKIAPHTVSPRSFFFPFYKNKSPSSLMMKTGLFLYDWLSFDRNKNINNDNKIPRHKSMNKLEARCFESGIHKDGLKSALFYYDYVNQSPERLCYEFIYAGKKHGGTALNYSRVDAIRFADNTYELKYSTNAPGKKVIVQAKSVVNVAGPWADIVNKLVQKKIHHNIIRSAGIHIVTRKIAGNSAVVLIRPDGSHLFILPLNGRSLIGTTDKIYKGNPDSFYVKKSDIEKLINDINDAYLAANLKIEDVEYYYGGLRPLVEQESSVSSYDVSRKLEIEDHKHDGLPGFFTVLGGKYTTSRLLAEKTVDLVLIQLSKDLSPCRTSEIPLPGGDFENFAQLYKKTRSAHRNVDNYKIWLLTQRYGSLAFSILKQKSFLKETPFKIANGELYYAEEISWICQNEDVIYLEDLLFRRSTIGIHGCMNDEQLKRLATYVGKIKGWSKKIVEQEFRSIKNKYIIRK